MRKLLLLAASVFCLSMFAYSQPRATDATTTRQVPPVFEAQYEGGIFGFSKKTEGTLKFDDSSSRLVFYGKDNKEKFGIPYDAVMVIYPNSQSATSTAGTVISHVPLPGAGLASLIKKKKRYLVLQYDDQDMENVRGTANFKIENQELLDSLLEAIGAKARLTRRGDAYYRPKGTSGTLN